MRDEIQNLTDLIGALAEDIEEIKTIVKSKDMSYKDEAVKRLEAKLESVIRFFRGSAADNINDIFKSKESIASYRKSQCDEMAASLLANMEANEQDMLKHGIPTRYGILQQSRPQTKGISFSRKCKAISKRIKTLWRKLPECWYKNPYAWTGICCTLVFLALFTVSWMQWHEYREENSRLGTVADKHKVTTVILKELYPELAISIGAYEKLVETVGADSTLAIFNRQLERVNGEESR